MDKQKIAYPAWLFWLGLVLFIATLAASVVVNVFRYPDLTSAEVWLEHPGEALVVVVLAFASLAAMWTGRTERD